MPAFTSHAHVRSPCAQRARKGFTLVELMVVTVIIGILAMLAVPKLSGLRDRAMLAVVESDLRSAMRAADLFSATHGALPSTLDELEGWGVRRTSEVRFCVFQRVATPAPHLHIEATHRRLARGMATRHPLWEGRIDLVESPGCDEVPTGGGPSGPPGGTPPGQGGKPPGQGGTPPGQGGTPPGRGG